MENTIQDVERINQKFQSCQKVFAALGDETRQYIVSVLLCGECSGSRVLDIAQMTNLSRPAVSHHMQVLKNAGIVKTRKEGTLVYYYLDPEESENGESIDCQLADMGVEPSNIDYLFFSHLDFDHTSGLELLRGVGKIRAAGE